MEVAESDDEPDVYNDEKCAGAVVVKARGLGRRISYAETSWYRGLLPYLT